MTALRAGAARVTAAMLVVVVLAACGPPAGTLFHATLSSPDGSYLMPVTLGDTTGLVLSMEPTVREEWLGDQPTVTVDPGDPSVLILSWTGGACEDETVIGFWPDEDRFGMYVSPRGATPLFGGCPAIALLRALRITLSAPVAPDRITFSSAA